MLAAYWIAVDNNVNCYVYKEYCSPNLPISAAAKAIIDTTNGERIHTVLAPPDLWGRSQETGKSKAILFGEAGLSLTRSSNDREAGWLSIKELLRLNAEGEPRLKIFRQCHRLITHLPQLIIDPKRPTDTLNEPHDITHSPDALRYFAIFWVKPNKAKEAERVRYTPDQLEDWRRASPSEREYLAKKYGGKPIL
jgi:phage terminase large subunit